MHRFTVTIEGRYDDQPDHVFSDMIDVTVFARTPDLAAQRAEQHESITSQKYDEVNAIVTRMIL